jgi:hypothetical protein
MVEVEDAVRARQADNQRMLARSYQIWSSYSREANFDNRLQPCFVQLRNILGRVPAFLAKGLTQHSGSPQLKLEQRGSKDSELFISGQSTWHTTNGDCDLEDKIIPLQLLLGIQRSTPCYFANDSRFANWPGLQDEGRRVVGGNYLAILAFAWAYIVSARWLEMQQFDVTAHVPVQGNDRIFYLDAEAEWICDRAKKSPDEVELDLGDVDDDAARWWAAILATGDGWRAEITRNGTVYRSPWSICIAATQSFTIRKPGSNQNMRKGTFVPSSSEVALKYLSDFSTFHCIDSQCSVALATTLTFPFLGARSAKLPLANLLSTNTMLTTPHPSLVERHQKKGTILEESKLLPYYMTLSCNIRGMYALLCGSFFDPQVSCNLVSPWFQPILEIISPLVKAGDFEKVAIIMGKRQPKLAALWVGATISGMASVIFQGVRIGLTAIELHASAWTATAHTFISLKSEIPYGNDDTVISRWDECRLLYFAEAEGHARLPVCPWRPFGATRLCDTEIEVRQHAKCAGHHLQYISWSWNLHNGCALEDLGFAVDEEHKDTSVATIESGSLDLENDRFLKDEVLSENATRSIFGWLRNSGWPKNEKDIYSHSWIDFHESDEEIEDTKSVGGAIQDANTQQAIEGWVVEQHDSWYFGIDET